MLFKKSPRHQSDKKVESKTWIFADLSKISLSNKLQLSSKLHDLGQKNQPNLILISLKLPSQLHKTCPNLLSEDNEKTDPLKNLF